MATDHPWPKGYYITVRGKRLRGPFKSLPYVRGVRDGLLFAKRYKAVGICKSLGPVVNFVYR